MVYRPIALVVPMNRPHAPTRGPMPLSAHSLGRVAAVSLAMTLVLPAVVVALTYPGLALAFVGGALTARVSHSRPTGLVARLRATAGSVRQPASDT